MPIPTPPKKDLLKVTPPRQATKKVGKPTPRVPGRPSKATQKLSKEIRDLTEAQKIESNTVPSIVYEKDDTGQISVKPTFRKTPFKPSEHLTQTPFGDNPALRKLSYDLKKETDPKKPVKRSPKRTSATKTTGAK